MRLVVEPTCYESLIALCTCLSRFETAQFPPSALPVSSSAGLEMFHVRHVVT